MVTNKAKRRASRSVPLLFLGLLGLGLLLTMLLQGTDVRVLNPQGSVALGQYRLILFSVLVMGIIAVPTLFLLYFFAWKYRETNPKATYSPDITHGKFYNIALWALPTVFVIILAAVMWPATHKLAPRRAIDSTAKPVTIQVVALRWKWLFIYPEQNIATVNYVQMPVNTPVRFELTADEAPMNSFWIPNLGGQLYAMTGHVNPLYLMADKTGDYQGTAAEISGAGFAGMKFTARASSQADFDAWVTKVQNSPKNLDDTSYGELLKPSENVPADYFASADPELYDKVLMKYGGHSEHAAAGHEGASY